MGNKQPVLNDFTTLANKLQKMLKLEHYLTNDGDKWNILTEEKSDSDNDMSSEDIGIYFWFQ